MKNYKKYMLMFTTLIVMTLPSFLVFNNPTIYNIKTSDASDINLDITSLTIPYGTNLQEDRSYTFSGLFYDTSDLTREWFSDCYFETKYLVDTDVWSNDSISSYDNVETQSPDASSVSITEGSLYQNGDLDQLNDNPSIFNSSYDYVEADDITTNYGTEDSSGDLVEIDGSYSEYLNYLQIYEPEYFDYLMLNYGNVTSGTKYHGTYSFENDPVASYGYGQSGSLVSNCEFADTAYIQYPVDHVDILSDYKDHDDVIRLWASNPVGTIYVRNEYSSQTSGTVELWFAGSRGRFYLGTESNKEDITMKFRTTYGNYVRIYYGDGVGGSTYYSTSHDSNWHHAKFTFDCITDTFSAWLDEIQVVFDENFYNDRDSEGMTATWLYIHTDEADAYFDVIGYSWDSGYDVGDNLEPFFADMSSIDGDYVEYLNYLENYYPDYFNDVILSYGDYLNGTIYDGTYSFDDLTSNPFYEVAYGSCSSDIVDYNGHDDVLKLTDSDSSNYIYSQITFSGKESGTVEYWTAYQNNYGLLLWLAVSGTTVMNTKVESNVLYVRNNTIWENCGSLNEEQWYHVRIDFECSTNAYLGLSQYTYRVYLNNTDLGVFAFQNGATPSSITTIGMSTYSSYQHTWYIDAIGFSWDSNYDIGDNLVGYFADMSSIDGDYVQYSSSYETDAPTYEEYILEGINAGGSYYNASFNCDTLDDFVDYSYIPAEITNYDGHREVLNLSKDNDNSHNADVRLTFDPQEYGTIEAWIYIDNKWDRRYFLINQGTATRINFYQNDGNFYNYDGVSSEAICSTNMYTWYHIRIDFECGSNAYQGLSADTYFVYINGIKYGSYDFQAGSSNLYTIRMFADEEVGSTYYTYYDAIGLSWLDNYSVGDNYYGIYSDMYAIDGEYTTFNSTEPYIYPATYTFTDDVGLANGSIPFINAGYTEYPNTSVSVIPEYDDGMSIHRDVLKISDNSTTYGRYAIHSFGTNYDQNATVEMWIAMESLTSNHYFQINLLSSHFNGYMLIQPYGGVSFQCRYYDGSWHNLISDMTAGWHHHRFTLDDYNDLIYWYVDGELIGICNYYQHPTGDYGLVSVQFYTAPPYGGYDVYIDAFGYSYDPDYHIGDNNYWRYYQGTYDFEDTDWGDVPDGWTDSSGTDCYSDVVPFFDNHSKVLRLFDNSSSNSCGLNYYFDEVYNDTTIEFYQLIDSVVSSDYCLFTIMNDAEYAFTMMLDGNGATNHYQYYNGTAWNVVKSGLTVNTWIHHKIIFNDTSQTIDWYIDGVLVADDIGYRDDVNGINRIWTYTRNVNYNYSVYFDAIGFDFHDGNFTGTYSFDSDVDGSNPSGWTVNEGTDTSIDVVSSLEKHIKIVNITDESASLGASMLNTFSYQEYGCIEFWCYKQTSNNLYFWVQKDSSTVLYISISTALLGVSAPLYQWNHIRIYFECGTSGYMGLSQYHYRIYVNNVASADTTFTTNVDSVNKFTIFTSSAQSSSLSHFIDAVAYSWTSGYSVGDNVYDDNIYDYNTGDNLRYNIYPTVNLTFITQLDMDFRDLYLYYSFKVDTTQTINMTFYNYYTLQWDLINSSIPLDFYSDGLSLDSCYYNSSGYMKINIIGINETEIFNEFQLYLEMLYVKNSPIFQLDTIIDCELLGGFFYAYKTNVTQSIETYLYNFTSSSYDLIENSTYLDYVLNNYTLNSDYFNGTSIMTKFYSVNQSYVDFSFYLEVLKMVAFPRFELEAVIDCELLGGLFYAFETNISQSIEVYIYDFTLSSYSLLENSTYLSYTLKNYTLNTDVFNGTSIKVKFYTINYDYDNFSFSLEVLHVHTFPRLDLESVIDCELTDNYFYSYKTNITQSIEVYIYDFTLGSYHLIENSSYLTFNLNYTGIISDYHNGTSIKVRFSSINYTYNDFSFYLEVLKVQNITRLDLTMYVEIEEYYDYLLHLNSSGFYHTNIQTLVNFSIYNFTSLGWILINSSINDIDYYKSEYICNTSILYDLINTSANNQILFRFQSINITHHFDLLLDCLNVTIHRKLLLSSQKSFSLTGLWKYRFHIPEDSYSSSWIYFEVVMNEPEPELEIISESEYYTRWNFMTSPVSETLLYEESFSSIFDNNWELFTDSGEDTFSTSTYVDDTYVSSNNNGSNYGNQTLLYLENEYDLSDQKDILLKRKDIYSYLSEFVDTTMLYMYQEEYDNLTDWNYVMNIDISGQTSWGADIVYYNDHYYVSDFTYGRIYEYDLDWNYVQTIDKGTSGQCWGLEFIDGYFYIVRSNASVLIYDTDWNSAGVLNVEDIEGITPDEIYPQDIFWDGEYWWIIGEHHGVLYKVNKDWEKVAGWNYLHIEQYIRDFYYDGEYMWLVGVLTDKIYKVEISGSSLVVVDSYPYGASLGMDFGMRGNQGFVGVRTYIRVFDYNGYTIGINSISNFDEDTVSNDTRPDVINMIGSYTRYKNEGWMSFNIGEYSDYYEITGEGNNATFRSSEYTGYEPYINDTYTKIYKGSGETGFTTNQHEEIGIISGTLSESLDENDIIEITFKTNSRNQISLELLNSDTVVYSGIVVDNDPKLEYTTIQFLVKEGFDFDQIKISGVLDDTDYFIVSDISIKSYDIEKTVFLEPDGRKELNLNDIIGSTENYTVYVYENDILCEIFDFTTGNETVTLIFTVSYEQQVYINFYDSDNNYLSFYNFKTYVNYTLNNVSRYNERLLSNSFYVDSGSLIDFSIYDIFDILVEEYSAYENTFIDINLDIFSLKIKNDATEDCKINITRSSSSNYVSDLLVPEEIVEYYLSSGTYNVVNLNYENNETKTYQISLTEDTVLILPTIFHQIYFSLFDSTGIGLDTNSFQLYINGSKKDFGYNMITSDYIYVVVYDYFYQIAYVEMLYTVNVFVKNIFINLVSLKIQNRATETVNYTLVKGSYNDTGNILPDEIIEYNVVAGNYSFSFTNQENWETTSVYIYLVNDTVYIINTTYYDVYFSAYLINGLGLDKDAVKFYINGSRNDFGFNTLSSNYVNLTVLDFFNQTAYSNIVYTYGLNEYSIYINLKSLKIQNRATELVNYTLTKGSLSQTGYILSDEIIEYLFISGSYNLSYTNHENMETDSSTISLTEDVVYMINTSYFDVYFSVFNYDGLGLDGTLFRFYINGIRKDFGFNTLSQDTNNLVVKDFFNATLKDITIDLSDYTEYNLIVEVYTMFIINNYNRTIKISITREGSDIIVEQIIPSRSGLEYRFLPNIEYSVYAYEQNGTLLDSETFTLDEQYEIVDFGFYQEVLPVIPEPFVQSNYMLIFILFCIIVVITMVGIIISFRYKGKENFEEKGVFAKNKIKNGKSGMSFDFRLLE